MLAFGASESHEFVNSGWTFIARPVRASDENCLACHGGREIRPSLPIATDTSLKIGDALGAAIYGYRMRR